MEPYLELNEYMKFIVPDANSRILGQQNIHFNILDVYAYWSDPRTHNTWGSYQIEMVVNKAGAIVAPWVAFLVKNIQLGQGFPAWLYFWGQSPGLNTVVTRYQFWKLYLLSGISANIRNRLRDKNGQGFVPIADETNVLEYPLHRS
jgi:hypothetical protein